MKLNISNVLQFVLHFVLLSYSCEEEILKPSSSSAQLSVEDLDLQKMLDFVRELSGPMIVMSASGQDFSHVNGDQVKKALGEYFVRYHKVHAKNFKFLNFDKLSEKELKGISENDMKSQVLHYIKELKKLIDKGLVYKDNTKKEASESSSVSLIAGWKARSGDIVGIRDITSLVTKHYEVWKKAH